MKLGTFFIAGLGLVLLSSGCDTQGCPDDAFPMPELAVVEIIPGDPATIVQDTRFKFFKFGYVNISSGFDVQINPDGTEMLLDSTRYHIPSRTTTPLDSLQACAFSRMSDAAFCTAVTPGIRRSSGSPLGPDYARTYLLSTTSAGASLLEVLLEDEAHAISHSTYQVTHFDRPVVVQHTLAVLRSHQTRLIRSGEDFLEAADLEVILLDLTAPTNLISVEVDSLTYRGDRRPWLALSPDAQKVAVELDNQIWMGGAAAIEGQFPQFIGDYLAVGRDSSGSSSIFTGLNLYGPETGRMQPIVEAPVSFFTVDGDVLYYLDGEKKTARRYDVALGEDMAVFSTSEYMSFRGLSDSDLGHAMVFHSVTPLSDGSLALLAEAWIFPTDCP